MIYNEDCLDTLKRDLEYDYIITSPPDLDEIGYTTTPAGIEEYYRFLVSRISLFAPKNGVVTIINRDRKANGTVIRKHNIFCNAMEKSGWVLKSQRVWVRSYKANLYRYNYSFIQTFKKNASSFKGEQSIPDAFFYEIEPLENYKDNYPPELIKQFIEVYCPSEDGIIFDPFMGSGSTAIAAINSKKKYAGAEIVKEVFELSQNRLSTIYDEGSEL